MALWTLVADSTSDAWQCDNCPSGGRIEHGDHSPATAHVSSEAHTVTVTYQHHYDYAPVLTEIPEPGR